MISASSGVHSKSDPGETSGSRRARPGRGKVWLLPLAAALAALALAAGPTLLLHLLLKNMFPPESGLALNYDRARAGFLFGSARVEGLRLELRDAEAAEPLVTVDSLALAEVSRRNLIRLIRDPADLPPVPLHLARDVAAAGVAVNLFGQVRAGASDIKIRNPIWTAEAASAAFPLLFDHLEAGDLKYIDDNRLVGGLRFELSRLEARDLKAGSLGGLELTLLDYQRQAGQSEVAFSLNGLKADGLNLSALRQTLKNRDALWPLWWLVAGCDRLELALAVLNLDGREALNLKSAAYDYIPGADEETTYLRRLNFSFSPAVLAEADGRPLWASLRDMAGDTLEGELSLEAAYAGAGGRLDLKSLALELPAAGRLEINGRLFGVPAPRAHYSPYQILFGANAWRLESLSLDFEDRGLAAGFYRHLDKTFFADVPPGRSTADNLMAYVVDPLAYELQQENTLANLPALRNEAEAFVRRPGRLRLTSAPSPPLTMEALHLTHILALANIDKYDIIEKLRLTVEVDQRAPVFVAVKEPPLPAVPFLPPPTLDQGLDLPF